MTKGGNQYSKIIERFLKTTDRINWAKEVAVTKRLVNEFDITSIVGTGTVITLVKWKNG